MSVAARDLNQLIALQALLEETNVSRAAARLGVGQPAMSSSLARLRRHYKDELLVRIGRDYELTPLARLLLPQVRQTVALIEQALGIDEEFQASRSSRVFTVIASDHAAVELHPRISHACSLAPHARIEIMPLPEQPSHTERELLDADFAVLVPGAGFEGQSTVLYRDEYVCLVDAANPRLVDGRLSWEDFTDMPHAVAHFGSGHRTPADRHLAQLGFVREPRVKTHGYLPIPSIVAGTDLVALVPARLARRLAPLTGTVAVPPPFERVEIVETLWWHASKEQDAGHRWLKAILASEPE